MVAMLATALCADRALAAAPRLAPQVGEMARQTPGSPKEENPPAGDGDVRKAFLETLQALGKMLAPLALITLLAMYLMKLWRRFEPRFCDESRSAEQLLRCRHSRARRLRSGPRTGSTRRTRAGSSRSSTT